MDQVTHNRIFAFNWGVADDVLRETEEVPLLEEGGIEAFIRRGMLRYTPDARVNHDSNRIGYEISFTRPFYKPQSQRTLAEINADILAIEKEADGLMDGLLVAKAKTWRRRRCPPAAA